MNCDLMVQYIKFVADRLLVELECPKVRYKVGSTLILHFIDIGNNLPLVLDSMIRFRIMGDSVADLDSHGSALCNFVRLSFKKIAEFFVFTP